MENLTLYNSVRAVPTEAQRTIQAGKLKGKTDINPMWRIKTLTEKFGPVGFGWNTEIKEHWIEQQGEQACQMVRIHLRVCLNGAWSEPIEGVGGSMLMGKGTGGDLNDEALKMAYTDAISVACKSLGMAADVYYASDRTKYDMAVAQKAQPKQFTPEPVETQPLESQNINYLFPEKDEHDTIVDDLDVRLGACKDMKTLVTIWDEGKVLLAQRPDDLENFSQKVAKLNRQLSRK